MSTQPDERSDAERLGRRSSLPQQRCDIVMKGGITSGIVYPKAVARLGEVYAFKNIGGTSAGAIAAVAAAAAEYGYQAGNAGAFERLARVPEELGARKQGKNSRLLLLFQPQPATQWILAALLAFLRDPQRWMPLKALGALAAVCGAFPVRTLAALVLGLALIVLPLVFGPWQGMFPMLGALVGLGALQLLRRGIRNAAKGATAAAIALLLIVPVLHFGPAGTWYAALGALGGVLGLVLLFAVLVLLAAIKSADRAIAGNSCGVCSGMEGAFGDGETPLAVWMADIFDELAGHSPDHADPKKRGPVTFGDLWGTRDPKEDRRVNLVTVTANLNTGRPYSLPFLETDEKRFWFDRVEFERLFPRRIVDWLVAHPNRELIQYIADTQKTFPNLHPLPEPADIPIVVAARMSMSFPVLLSAVPLHQFQFLGKSAPDENRFRRCWFSDGGMCSNLPVHLFDGVLPRWPTFAINLRYFKKNDPELEPRVRLPEDNGGGAAELPHDFDPAAPKLFVGGLVGAIKHAMQNWVDNSQIRMPGYRDRVAHIHLDSDEGGMNLNMEKDLIDRIAGYGKDAAELFIEHFRPGATVDTNWDNHRWVRFRSGMAMLEEKLFTAARALQPGLQQPGFGPYDQLIGSWSQNPKAPYGWANAATRQSALKILGDLRALLGDWQADGTALRKTAPGLAGTNEIFLDKAPKPSGYFRVMPRF